MTFVRTGRYNIELEFRVYKIARADRTENYFQAF